MKENQFITLKKKTDFAVNQINNCCNVGCSFCCYQLIEVFDFEKQAIKNAVNKLSDEMKAIIKLNLESWFNFFNQNTPENKVLDEKDTIVRLMELDLSNKHQCPLLVDNLCAIYSNRPLACRVHVVESKPELCDKDPYRASSRDSHNIRSEIFADIKMKKKYSLIFLPYIITEVIQIHSKLKPIKKMPVR
ncbi:Putative zinc-or iron-chelating domain-containing protein [Chryseobacterium oleae]|uniref:Putative zinc-or iron-chelating domain-containing protein n=1 Tax=Chryseobacterium oleae TaxID=491207 RepID=A0A1I4VYX2_CHROL|nr:YkgJ family cysteine cluster protein [Chryseobacterium oleae]SFN06166.1 Putative zinc-or iron-chelating domain-containing protein [Chryseobacterium oleae]